VLRVVTGFTPLVAQWYKSTHPSQERLYEYLDWIKSSVGPVPLDIGPLYLHLEVDVEKKERLVKGYDLENFLTPLFSSRCLGSDCFVLVSAEKRVGGGSSVRIGRAEQLRSAPQPVGWSYFGWSATSAVKWRERLRQVLSTELAGPVLEGLSEVRIAWRCSRRRSWVNLWKATGDAMGPILGEYPHSRNTSPRDDRIVSQEFHLNSEEMGNALEVGIWWRLRIDRAATDLVQLR